jgi:lysophospholipase L1-like esterase
MARTNQGKRLGAAFAGLLIAGSLITSAIGEDAVIPSPAVPAPLSPECQSGSTEIVSESPLPHVAAALQKSRTIRILAIGSSAGRSKGGYTNRIERILKQVLKGANVVIINRGVSGELAASAAQRLKNEVALTRPHLVIWQVGTNDAMTFVPLEELAETVTSTIRWLKEHNVDVVLAGLQYVARVAQDDHYYRVRELMREIAAKENVMIIRRYEAMQFIAATQDAGGAHSLEEFERTETGYQCLAQYLASAITLGAFGKGMSKRPLRSQPGQSGQAPDQQAK